MMSLKKFMICSIIIGVSYSCKSIQFKTGPTWKQIRAGERLDRYLDSIYLNKSLTKQIDSVNIINNNNDKI